MDMTDTNQATQLSDAKTKLGELEVKLKEASDKSGTAEAKATAADAKVGELTLQLKETSAKLTSSELMVAKIEPLRIILGDGLKKGADVGEVVEAVTVELKKLRDDKIARDEADVKSDVEIAYDTYEDQRKLVDKDKEHMLAMRRATPAAFIGMFPPVAPSERHLLRGLVSPETRPRPEPELSLTALTRKLMVEQKLNFADAQIEACRLLTEQAAAAA